MCTAEETDWVAVYRASFYAFAAEGAWRGFALDGAPDVAEPSWARPEHSVTLITAWNPDSVERPQPENEAAQARLLRALTAEGVAWSPAYGASLPGTEPAWREDGFAMLGLDESQACDWGRRFGQLALVRLDGGGGALLLCADGSRVACRVRAVDASQGTGVSG